MAPAAEASEEEDEAADAKPALTSGDVFRRLSGSRIKQEEAESSVTDDNGNGNERKLSFHSGLSALIEAATTQLGQVEDGSNLAHGQASTGATTPRYTSHGFHTNSTETKTPYNSMASASLLQTTPTLGPEVDGLSSLTGAATTTEARQQTFPEILMTVLEDRANANVATFLPDGQFFALRRKEFSETSMMSTYFAAASFGEFLEKIHNWGFLRIIDHRTSAGTASAGDTEDPPDYSSGIEIFRHPMFAKGDWERCSRICFGESPMDARLSALPDRARIEYTLSDESTLNASKRRLSPSHTRRASESSLSKQRLSSTDIHAVFDSVIFKSESADTTSTDASATCTTSKPSHTHHSHQSPAAASNNNVSSSPSVSVSKMEDDLRSLALAITTEKLDLKTDVEEHVEASTPLIQKAVENATCTIVTDAIETLLRDEDHTRETYLKHERELSKSSLPGVVPISKQLFAQEPPSQNIQENLLAAAAAAAEVIMINDSRNITTKTITNGENAKSESKHQDDEAVVSDDNEGTTTADPPPAQETSSSNEDQSLPVAKLTAGDDVLTTSSST